MSMPIAIIALISWLKNPYKGNKSEVAVNNISKKETVLMTILATIVTIIFYYILKYFNTANLIPSTLSITTSFLASYLTFRRSPYYALFYAANDIVLIVLWVLASITDISYLSVVICFIVFLVNDLYGFINWKRMEKRQKNNM
jgi:nicotinamide mononucleotide transporter PnuC